MIGGIEGGDEWSVKNKKQIPAVGRQAPPFAETAQGRRDDNGFDGVWTKTKGEVQGGVEPPFGDAQGKPHSKKNVQDGAPGEVQSGVEPPFGDAQGKPHSKKNVQDGAPVKTKGKRRAALQGSWEG